MDEFDPIIEASPRSYPDAIGPVNSQNLAPRGLFIVPFMSPATAGSTVHCLAGAVPSTLSPMYPHGATTKVCINKNKGDFSSTCGGGLNASQTGMVDVPNDDDKVPKGYVVLEPNTQYYFNIQYKDKAEPRGNMPSQPEISAQLSFMVY